MTDVRAIACIVAQRTDTTGSARHTTRNTTRNTTGYNADAADPR
jgi:hypothetical protein